VTPLSVVEISLSCMSEEVSRWLFKRGKFESQKGGGGPSQQESFWVIFPTITSRTARGGQEPVGEITSWRKLCLKGKGLGTFSDKGGNEKTDGNETLDSSRHKRGNGGKILRWSSWC